MRILRIVIAASSVMALLVAPVSAAPATPGQAGPDVVSQTYILPGDAGFIGADLTDFPEICPDATVTRTDDPFEVQGNFVVRDL